VLLGFALCVTGAAQAADDDPQAAVAEATGSGPLETSIVVEKLQVGQGLGEQELRRWVPAQRLNIGDEVHYTVRVRNPSKEPVTHIVVTKRLPFGVRYELDSATGPSCVIQLSADGGRSFTAPPGKKASRKTSSVEYTHVRWMMNRPLAPGATALLRFRAKFS
jgi:uncharacterized repeat protein (TIGR01451 family)